MAETARHLPVIAALEAAIPDAAALVFASLGIALALHGRRALRARALNLAAVGTSVFMNVLAAAPGWRNLAIWALPPVAYALASDTLIGVVRAWAIARHQHLGTALAADAPTPLTVLGGLALWLLRLALAPASTLAGFRAWVLEECPVAPGRRARPAPPPARSRPGRGRRTVPRKATKTARFLDMATERHGSLASIPLDAVAGISAELAPLARPAPRRRPRRPAQGRPGREERSPPMIVKYAIALAVVLVLAAFATWAFLPARHLPGNRARHLRIRLHLRLHPGKGFAHLFTLHLRWSRFAALRRSGRIRPALPLRYRILDPREHSVFLGRAHYRHGLRVPLEEHLLVMAPPRTFKTAFLADVILRYRGPVIATTTKADLFKLTSAVRSFLGPVHVFNPQHIGGVPSTFCWYPVDGCEDPATAIRRADAFAFAVSQKGVEDGTFWSAKASRLPARLLPRRRPGPLRPARRRRLGLRRRPRRPRTDPGRRRRPPVGADPGRTPLRGPQDRRDSPDGHEQVPGLHGRPGPGRLRPARPRHRLRHPRVPARCRHRLHDRRSRLRGSASGPAVRRHGVRDPLDRGADRPGIPVGAAGSAAA